MNRREFLVGGPVGIAGGLAAVGLAAPEAPAITFPCQKVPEPPGPALSGLPQLSDEVLRPLFKHVCRDAGPATQTAVCELDRAFGREWLVRVPGLEVKPTDQQFMEALDPFKHQISRVTTAKFIMDVDEICKAVSVEDMLRTHVFPTGALAMPLGSRPLNFKDPARGMHAETRLIQLFRHFAQALAAAVQAAKPLFSELAHFYIKREAYLIETFAWVTIVHEQTA
jgi:hypothetical protein